MSTISKDEANKLFKAAKKELDNYDQSGKLLRKYIYNLIETKSYKVLEYPSYNDLIADLTYNYKRHRSTIRDYKVTALIELELNIEHDSISIDAIMELQKDTDKKQRKEILKVARELLKSSTLERPTKKIIIEAKNQISKAKQEESDFDDITNEDLLEAPKARAKAKPSLEDLDDYGFSETEYETPAKDSKSTKNNTPVVGSKVNRISIKKASKYIQEYPLKQTRILYNLLIQKNTFYEHAFSMLRSMDECELAELKSLLETRINAEQ